MKKLIYSLSLGLLTLCAASCDTTKEPAPWQPAEATDSPGIFFTNSDNLLSITAGEDTHVSIPVRRLYSEGELTVPLVVEAGHPDLAVPSSVTFADGEIDSKIVIDLASVPTKEPISLSITFPAEYISPYAAGASAFEGTVLVSDWEPVQEGPVTLKFFDWSYAPSTLIDPIEQEMQYLPGTTRYRILNFFNSGYTFTFEVKPSEYAAWLGYYRIIPLGNQVLYSEYEWTGYYNPWWLVSDDKEEWPVIELSCGGQPFDLYGASFMWYDDEYENEYCFMRVAGTPDVYGNLATKNFMYMAFYGFYTEDWDWSLFTGYLRAYIEFPALP